MNSPKDVKRSGSLLTRPKKGTVGVATGYNTFVTSALLVSTN